MPGIIARKIGMTQIFKQGAHVPVTLLDVSGNVVVGQKQNKVLVGAKRSKHVSKPVQGILKKANITAIVNMFKEFDWKDSPAGEAPNVGSQIGANIFETGKQVTVTATSKGKGFAGTVKRHSFSRGPETHGSANVRKPGSIGAQQPQRVTKGKKMAGHMGNVTVTVKNLEVVEIDSEKNLLAIRGSIPGPNKGWVFVKQQVTGNK